MTRSLAISEELRAAYDALPHGAVIYTSTGERLFLNRYARKDLAEAQPNLDVDALIGRRWDEGDHWDPDPEFVNAFEAVASGRQDRMELERLEMETTRRAYTLTFWRDEAGRVHLFTLDRGTLPAGDSAIGQLIADFPFGACYVFDKDLRYLAAYGRGVERGGYSRRQIVGARAEDLWDPEVFRQLSTPYAEALEGGEADFLIENDGRIYRNWASGVHGADGEISAGVVLVWDVTAEMAVQDTLDLVRRSIDALPLGVTLSTATTGAPIVYANNGFAELVGIDRDALLGEDFRIVIGPESSEEAVERINRAVDRGDTAQEVMVGYRDDGSTFWNRLTVSPIRIEGDSVTHLIGVHEDVSEQRRTGQELELTRRLGSLGQLAGGLAHDMRNVLTGTGLIIDLLAERTDLPADVISDLREVHGVLDRGASITSRLLTFAQGHTFERGPVELNDFVENRIELVRTLLRESVEVRASVTEGATWIIGNGGQLDQALLNLAKNAEGAMPNGGTLVMRVRDGVSFDELGADPPEPHDPGSSWAVLSVCDDGTGMSRDVRERAFEPFFTTRMNTGGTGLGLASVYGVVTGLGGACWIDSREGVGTEVHMAFPRASAPDADETGPTQPESRFDGLRVLFAEDDAAIRRACTRFLESRGAIVDAVEDGASGRARMVEEGPDYDLLVTDAVMPALSGPGLIEHARESSAGIACLLISGYTDVAESELPPGVPLLEKPFSMQELSTAIVELLGQRAAAGI